MIRWSKGDYIRLGKAVSDFNKQIAKNTTEANKQYLPEMINYKELKERIQTREGLNAYIQGLKRINNQGAFDLERLAGGEVITRYQKGELQRGVAQATKVLQREANKLEQQKKIELGLDVDISLPEAFKLPRQKEFEAKIKEYKELFKLRGKDFKKMASYIGFNQTELKFRRAYVFRQNYMKVMKEHYSHLPAYKLFLEWANKHRNPINFYEALPDEDFEPNNLYYQSETYFSEDDFEAFLETLGIDVSKRFEEKGAKKGMSGTEYKEREREKIEQKAAEQIEKLFD